LLLKIHFKLYHYLAFIAKQIIDYKPKSLQCLIAQNQLKTYFFPSCLELTLSCCHYFTILFMILFPNWCSCFAVCCESNINWLHCYNLLLRINSTVNDFIILSLDLKLLLLFCFTAQNQLYCKWLHHFVTFVIWNFCYYCILFYCSELVSLFFFL